ncbi:hypothetical protein BJX63DRAFT_427810 [Aspergillus granulosus]|uniref:DUF3533 domain-containing protein n=1 Tax=Aspergillus granulosus TaxID=176169 RepID=A0ABR4I070_9EURO
MTPLKAFLVAVVGAAVSLQLLILANMSYLYGTGYRNTTRFSALKLLYVDYDHGVIGHSVITAYDQMRGPGFPTLHQHSAEEYPTRQDVERAVCKGGYWGAIYASSNASSRLSAALSSPEMAEAYDNSQALGYIWSSTKYPSIAQSVNAQLIQLTQGAAAVYKASDSIAALSTINVSDPYIARTVLDPISASPTDLNPMNQGVRFYYNTVSMVMPIIIQFFFIMALNGISAQTGTLDTLTLRQNTLIRFAISVIYTFLASLTMTGYMWAFREDWAVTSSQFGMTWIAIWLAMHVHFLLIDFAVSIIPMQFVPFFVLTWVIINVASTLSPFELSPGFYRVGLVKEDQFPQVGDE